MAYCEENDIFITFGRENVRKWADLDNLQDESTIAANIERAITDATSQINDTLKISRYSLPLEKPDSIEVPNTIVRICASIAGVFLYEGRGIQDWNPDTGQPSHKLEWHKHNSNRQLHAIKLGMTTINAKLKSNMSRPEVV